MTRKYVQQCSILNISDLPLSSLLSLPKKLKIITKFYFKSQITDVLIRLKEKRFIERHFFQKTNNRDTLSKKVSFSRLTTSFKNHHVNQFSHLFFPISRGYSYVG